MRLRQCCDHPYLVINSIARSEEKRLLKEQSKDDIDSSDEVISTSAKRRKVNTDNNEPTSTNSATLATDASNRIDNGAIQLEFHDENHNGDEIIKVNFSEI